MASSFEEETEELTPAALRLASEYETQFFNFLPKGFVDGIYNILFDTIAEKLADFKEKLMKEKPGAMSEEEIDKCIKEVQQRMTKHIQKEFDQRVIERAFNIPPNVCLPGDEIHEDPRLPAARKNRKAIEKETKALEKELATMTFVNTQLVRELKIIDAVREAQETTKAHLRETADIGNKLEDLRQKGIDEVTAALQILEPEHGNRDN